jgi:hypothetical protein
MGVQRPLPSPKWRKYAEITDFARFLGCQTRQAWTG